MHVQLETERLHFRQWRDTDVDPLYEFYRDPQSQAVYGSDISRSDVWRRIALILGHFQLRGFGLHALEDKATEAARRVRDHGFGDLGLARLVSYIKPLNANSIRVAEKLGAVPDGEFIMHGLPHMIYRHTSTSTTKYHPRRKRSVS